MRMLGAIVLIIACMCISVIADDDMAAQLKADGYRCVSNGLRQATAWRKLTQPDCLFRFRRKAMVDMKGELKLVFPTFYTGRKPGEKKVVEEVPFPNNLRIQAAIEPAFKMSSSDLQTSPRILSEIVECEKESKESYKIVTVDLGETVIKKGQWYGIWVLVENADGEKMLPFSRNLGSKKTQIFEAYYSPTGGELFKNNALATVTSFRPEPVGRKWARMGLCPVVILAKTDYTGDVWGIIGSSIPYGYYDIFGEQGDQYGDENGNAGYADKLFSTKLGCPSVNLSVGSDRFQYCAVGFIKRMEIMKLCDVNKVHYGLGGNDISGMRRESKLLADSKTLSDNVRAAVPGVYIVGATVLPHSTSKDKFTTLEGQTPRAQNAGPDSFRGKWNAMLRADPRPSGCDEIYEICSFVEYDWKNGASLWKVDANTPQKYTGDGTHPTCIGSEEIAKNAFIVKHQ